MEVHVKLSNSHEAIKPDDNYNEKPKNTQSQILQKKQAESVSMNEADGAYELNLDELPSEIILYICSFLNAKFVVDVLSKVSTFFHDVVNDKMFWKIRLAKRWPKKYPAIPVNDNEFDWIDACIQREDQHDKWSTHTENTVYHKFKEGIFAPVDAVHFFADGNLLASGSRDRYLNVLDMRKLDYDDPESIKSCRTFCQMDAHKGWIWSMASLDSQLATGSWDHYVKFWDLAAGGAELRKVKCKSPVLCTHFEPGYFMAGCYDKHVYHIDPRSAVLQAKKFYHRRAVLCMAVNDKYVLTGSEDNTIVVYDRRADKVRKTVTLESFPLSLSYSGDELWVGDKAGSLHLIDATDGDFNVVDTYENIHGGKVTGVIRTTGATYTCSTDKTVKVLEPTLNPGVITSLDNHTSDIARIAYANDILACACSDSSIGIWAPQKSQTEI